MQPIERTKLVVPRQRAGTKPAPSDPEHSRGEPTKAMLELVLSAIGADLGAVFMLSERGTSLRGARGIWDWVRSSFRVRVDLWPTVQRALAERRVVAITQQSARGLERDWFEPGAIQSCICAPIAVEGRVYGVLFADFLDQERELGVVELALAKSIARRWARTIQVARAAVQGDRTRRARRPVPRGATTVASVMSSVPPLVDARMTVAAAERIAAIRGATHLLAVRDGEVRGVVSRASLESARPASAVVDVLDQKWLAISAATPLEIAAREMLETGASCLPVVGDGREVVGAVTRADLRGSGSLPGERGVDVCACCGSSEHLAPREDGGVAFCLQCLSVSRSSELESVYVTLGGSG